ncbi:MAG: hypothetical protein R3B84_23320 [Zavarzinella sp.]
MKFQLIIPTAMVALMLGSLNVQAQAPSTKYGVWVLGMHCDANDKPQGRYI